MRLASFNAFCWHNPRRITVQVCTSGSYPIRSYLENLVCHLHVSHRTNLERCWSWSQVCIGFQQYHKNSCISYKMHVTQCFDDLRERNDIKTRLTLIIIRRVVSAVIVSCLRSWIEFGTSIDRDINTFSTSPSLHASLMTSLHPSFDKSSERSYVGFDSEIHHVCWFIAFSISPVQPIIDMFSTETFGTYFSSTSYTFLPLSSLSSSLSTHSNQSNCLKKTPSPNRPLTHIIYTSYYQRFSKFPEKSTYVRQT